MLKSDEIPAPHRTPHPHRAPSTIQKNNSHPNRTQPNGKVTSKQPQRSRGLQNFELLPPDALIGVFFEVGFTRAGALPARPRHFRVKSWTDYAQKGQSSLSGVSGLLCAQREVCALGGPTVFLLHSSMGLVSRGAPREQDLWVTGRVYQVQCFEGSPEKRPSRRRATPRGRRKRACSTFGSVRRILSIK